MAATCRGRAPVLLVFLLALGSGAVAQEKGGSYNKAVGGGGKPSKKERAVIESIRLGLEWLKGKQLADGSWAQDLRATSLVTLALLGNENTMRSGPYKNQVKGAMRWFRGQQDAATGRVGPAAAPLLDHAIATLATIECAGLSGSRLLKKSAQAGIAHLENSWTEHGWQSAGTAFDPVLHHYGASALYSGRAFGLRISETVAAECVELWTTRIAKAPRDSAPPMIQAAGIFPLVGLGDHQMNSTPVRSALAAVDAYQPETLPSPEYSVFSSYGTYQAGGPPWLKWCRTCLPMMLEAQSTAEKDRGAWGRGTDAQRCRETAMRVLALQPYHRFARTLRGTKEAGGKRK